MEEMKIRRQGGVVMVLLLLLLVVLGLERVGILSARVLARYHHPASTAVLVIHFRSPLELLKQKKRAPFGTWDWEPEGS